MTHVTDIPNTELYDVTGGDWVDTAWGIMLTAAFTAGFLGSGGLLVVAIGTGGLLLTDGWAF